MERVKVEIELNQSQKQLQEQTVKACLQYPKVQAFLKTNNLDESIVHKYPLRFKNWLDNIRPCQECKGLSFCVQSQKGHFMDLSYEGILTFQIRSCQFQKDKNQSEKHMKYFRINDMPPYLNTKSISDLVDEPDPNTLMALDQITKVLDEDRIKGFFLHGLPGVGKTYLAGCVCNYYAKANQRVAFVHVPTFTSRMKSLLDDIDELEHQILLLKTVDFLVLDDIGAESVTSWVRDELLLPILNERMEQQKRTWFTSNDDFNSLKNHFMYNQKQEKEEMKAVRLMERIETLSEELQIKGKNRRKSNK